MTDMIARPQAPWALRLLPPFPAVAHRILGLVSQSDVGALGLMSAYPDEYSRMLEVSNDFGFDLLRTERDLFEIDHWSAGAYLA